MKEGTLSAPLEVKDIVERFNRNREAYQSGKYKETQLRREFVDLFFESLFWDPKLFRISRKRTSGNS